MKRMVAFILALSILILCAGCAETANNRTKDMDSSADGTAALPASLDNTHSSSRDETPAPAGDAVSAAADNADGQADAPDSPAGTRSEIPAPAGGVSPTDSGHTNSPVAVPGRQPAVSHEKNPDRQDASAADAKPTEESTTDGNSFIRDANGIEYYRESDGTLWVAGIGTCTQKSFHIPDKVGGRPVVGVYSAAFTGNTDVEAVSFSEGIQTIGQAAFLACTSLKSVSFPSTLRRLENNAFSHCPIETLTLPDGLQYIGNGALSGCGGRITVPDSVETIGNLAFSGSSVEEITLPGGVTLGTSVFKGCASLKTVHLKNGITAIPNQTFMKCSSLTAINFPDSVAYYGTNAFYGCSKLRIKRLTLRGSAGSDTFSGIAIEQADVYSNAACSALSSASIQTLILHSGVTAIGESAFQYTAVSRLVLPATLTTVDSSAFYGCRIAEVDFQSAVSLGHSAFRNSTVQAVTLPAGSHVGTYAFSGCKSLQTVRYGGTKSQWSGMISIPNYGYVDEDFAEIRKATVICSDGTVSPQ